MSEEPDYLSDVLNDELWDRLEPHEQTRLAGAAAADARDQLVEINARLGAHDIPMTQAYRHRLRMNRETAMNYIELLTERRRRAKAAQTRKNIAEAESKASRRYIELRRAVVAHREATDSTDNPVRLGQANEALYMALAAVEAS